MPGQRRFLIFLGKAFLIILACSVVWPFVASGYTSMLVTATNAVAPSHVTLTAQESAILIYSREYGSTSVTSLPFQAGLVILLALILATPGLKVRRRLVSVVVGAIITFAIHVVSIDIIAINARGTQALIVLFASVGVDLFPVLVWMPFSAKYWWSGFQPIPKTSSEMVNITGN
jgi:hypothetical protein